jgi:hypothetical protein
MFDRLNRTSTKEQVFAAVEEVYGLPFEELEAEYFATAPTIYTLPGLCDGLLDIPRNGDRWELRVDSDGCGSHIEHVPGALGLPTRFFRGSLDAAAPRRKPRSRRTAFTA